MEISRSNKIIIVSAIAVIVIVLAIYLIKDYLKTAYLNSLEKTINSDNLTYKDKAQYVILANQLYTTMDGLGTDFNSIIRIIKSMNNADDFKQLIVAFKTKKASFIASSFEGDLIQWLTDELNNDEIIEVNQHLNMIGAQTI